MKTGRVDGVKAPPHDGTPRSYRQDEDDEARDGPKLLDVGRDLHAAHFIQLPVGRDEGRGVHVDGRDARRHSLSRRHEGCGGGRQREDQSSSAHGCGVQASEEAS